MVLSARRAVHLRAPRTPRAIAGIPGRRSGAAEFLAAGVCGSDLPGFRGTQGKLPGDTGASAAEMDGFPIHEIVGEVHREPSPRAPPRRPRRRLGVGIRRPDGARDRRRRWPGALRPLADTGTRRRTATAGLRAVRRRAAAGPGRPPRRRDRPGLDRAAVLLCGQGAGASHVTGVDPVDRAALGAGVRGGHRGARHQRPLGPPSRRRRQARRRHRGGRPSGGDAGPRHRGRGLRRHGVLLRGARRRHLPDQHAHDAAQQPDAEIRCDAGSSAGAGRGRRVRPRASRPAAAYLTHTFGVDDVQSAFELACRPTPGRVKIAIVE